MSPFLLWIVGAIVVLFAAALAAAWLLGRPRQLSPDERDQRQRDEFRRERERLEAQFFDAAARRGIPRGLAWVRCDFANEVAYARDRTSGDLWALVSVTIGFEAVEGGGMEEVEAVGNLRAATSVFRHDGTRWTTDGRAVMNLNPAQTIVHFATELEPMASAGVAS